jgi:soluble lytic murein transglycosylase-like protein
VLDTLGLTALSRDGAELMRGMHGRAGERGVMQVLPRTARSVGISGNLYDCATGIEAGLRYLRLAVLMHVRAGWCAVASAYNSGTWRGSRCTHYGRSRRGCDELPPRSERLHAGRILTIR